MFDIMCHCATFNITLIQLARLQTLGNLAGNAMHLRAVGGALCSIFKAGEGIWLPASWWSENGGTQFKVNNKSYFLAGRLLTARIKQHKQQLLKGFLAARFLVPRSIKQYLFLPACGKISPTWKIMSGCQLAGNQETTPCCQPAGNKKS